MSVTWNCANVSCVLINGHSSLSLELHEAASQTYNLCEGMSASQVPFTPWIKTKEALFLDHWIHGYLLTLLFYWPAHGKPI